jgi:DNA end-binding protein Ku
MPARAIDTATLSFGLVTIPVKIYTTAERSHELHFHLVHAGCGQRLRQRYVCPAHGEVDRDDMVKGFEITKGNIVELERSELAALEAVASDEISLVELVPVEAVDPILIDAHYYLGPDKGGERAYRLFRDALLDAGLVAIATYAARGKQYVVMVRPFEEGLVMDQLRYLDEVKPWSEIPLGKLPAPQPSELGLALQLFDSLRHDTFDPGHYKDEVKKRVRKLIADKAKGGEIVAPEREERVAPVDLMEALKTSLGAKAAPANGHRRRAHRSSRAKPASRSKPHARSARRKRTTRHASR